VIGDRHVGIYASPDNWRTCCSLLDFCSISVTIKNLLVHYCMLLCTF